MNKHYAELIGIVIGDGFLDGYQKHYRIGIVGNPKDEREYYNYIQFLIKKSLE